MKLSKNLSLAEVTKSVTAKRLGIDNTPDEWVTENLIQVAINIFQPIRDHFGSPIYVSSGYRSADLNRAIGGSKRSQHVEGRALDLDADVYGGCTNAQIFQYIKENLEFDQEKLKKQEQKIESGEITCNLDSPEDCESCSG